MNSARPLRPLAAPGAAAAAFVIVALSQATGSTRAVDLPVRDAVLRALPSRPPSGVAVVAVDEGSLAASGPWPWPRERLAALVDAVAREGARGLVVDLLLASPAAGDAALAASLGRLPSVLAAGLDAGAGWLLPPAALRVAARVAETSFDVDHDGVMRRLSSTKQRGGTSLTALTLAAVALGGGSPRPVPVGKVLVPDFRCRPRDVPVESATSVLSGRPAPALRGRVVFLGATAAGLGDRYLTPGSLPETPEPGVVVHAAATACLLRGGLLRPAPPYASGLLAAVLALGAVRAGRSPSGARRPLLAAIAVLPVVLGVPLLSAGVELPLATLAIAAAASSLAVEVRATRRGEREALAAVARAAAAQEEARESRRVTVHELKTPLTAVRGLTQLLSGVELTPAERQRVLAMVGEETERLGGLIESLNAAERLRLSDLSSAARPVDLGALVRRRVEALGTASGGRVAGEVEAGVLVLGDEPSLARAVDNLVGNALKFSPEGSKVLVRVGSREDQALLSVADEGPGIPEAERERVFSRFVRGSAAGGTEGLGLGLSLVSEVVTWHRGRVAVRSAEGRGSVFEVVLPLHRDGPVADEVRGLGVHPDR